MTDSEDKDFLAWKTLFQEQIDFFRQKLNLPTARWDDIWQAAHDRAFVVAGAQAADLLADLRSAVDRAIAGGGSIGEFRKAFDAIVQRHGWRGFTGDGSKAGIAWRTRVIYQTNMATSYAAGRWQQLNDPDLVKLRPYWQYIHADGVLHPRPLHLSWHGLTLPREHAFWQTHFPPNGWGCHCRVRAVGKREYDAAVAGGRGPEAAPADDDTAGIDPGWAYAPGASVAGSTKRIVQAKAENLPPPLAKVFEEKMAAVGAFEEQASAAAAARWAVKNNLVDFADYTGVKPEVANAFNRSLFEHLQEFPALRRDMNFIGTCQAQFARWREIEIERYISRLRAANPQLPRDFDFRPHAERHVRARKVGNQYAHAWAQEGVQGIGVNRKFGADALRFEASVAECASKRHFPPSNRTIRSVADHEFGHMLDYLLGLHLDNDVIQAYTEASASGMKDEVSGYAAKNIREFIAECWSESLNSQAPRAFARRVSAIIRARYRAKYP